MHVRVGRRIRGERERVPDLARVHGLDGSDEHRDGGQAERGRKTLVESGQELFEKGRELYERGREIAEDAAEMFERGRSLAEKTIDERV